MKYIIQLAIIGLITFVSELLSYFISLPVPAGIYGLVLLFLLLTFKVVRLEWVEDVANFLLAVMPVMFVPATVSLMTKWELIKDDIVSLVVTTLVSTVIIMIVSGLVTQWIIRLRLKRTEDGND